MGRPRRPQRQLLGVIASLLLRAVLQRPSTKATHELQDLARSLVCLAVAYIRQSTLLPLCLHRISMNPLLSICISDLLINGERSEAALAQKCLIERLKRSNFKTTSTSPPR